jgi:hypothetical protein
MKITYSHCVKYTPGQLDRAPFSAYIMKTVEIDLYRCSGDSTDPQEWFKIKIDGQFLSSGDTIDDAIFEAQYRLMACSRDVAVGMAVAA